MPRLDGFDGYHGQKEHGTNLAATLLAGLWWIAWKVSQSTQYLDPTFAGIRSEWGGFRMRGMYHWLSSTTDVSQQAANYLRGVGIIQHGEFCMLDAEEKGITVAMCLLWCELVEAITHRPCVIYTGLYVAGGTIWNSPELRMSKYGPRPFIVAAYVSEANLLARMAALGALPRDAWQYSSDGPVPGITGRCDMDQVDNVAAFELACEISHIVPQPSTEDTTMLRLLAPVDSPARFYADCDPPGRARRCEWTGDGNDPVVQARIEFYRNATPAGQDFEMPLHVANLINVSLDGPLPPGFRADQFGNPDEIHQRESAAGTVDNIARQGVAAVQNELHDVRLNLKAAGGD